MDMINVFNGDLGRVVCVPVVMVEHRYNSFFRGWSSASQRITQEETYKLTEKLKTRKCFDFDVGLLFGRVMSYQGLIYLAAEFNLPDEVFKQICHAYK